MHATDGDIGKVDETSNEVGVGYIVVDTGPWIFGRNVMLPAGLIRSVGHTNEEVFVDRTKDQIKDSPELDQADYKGPAYRDTLGDYYGRAF